MDETPETSENLIARVKDLADGDAWTEFLTMYRPVVVRLLERFTTDSPAKETVLSPLVSFELLSPVSSVKTKNENNLSFSR